MIDNRKQFNNTSLANFCEEFGIKKYFSTPNQLQANSQVKAINKIITHTLNTKFDTLKGGWVEELPSVMWSYHTTARSSTRETPYSLSFKVEAMIPLEIGIPSFYTSTYNQIENEKSLHKELDLVKEMRNGAELENAIINNAMQSITTRR